MAYHEEPRNPGKDDGKCGLCKKQLAKPEDHRCGGCGYTICEDCDETNVMGTHFVIEHQE